MTDRPRSLPPPPAFARLLLRLRTPPRSHEWIAGDLEEGYHAVAAREGVRAARAWYCAQVRAAVMPDRARARAAERHGRQATMTGFGSDLRDAARTLARSPGFTAAAVLMLALGIGVNTTVFSWLNAVLLSPVPGAADPGRLAQLGTTFKGNVDTSFSYPDYQILKATPGFDGIAARSERPLTLAVPSADGGPGAGAPERLWAELVSDNFFAVLGVPVAMGRAFLPSETRGPGDAPVVVISDGLWASHFDRAAGVLGRKVLVNGAPATIVGVAPERFQGSVPGLAMDLWLPLTQCALVAPDPNHERLTSRGWHWLEIVGRLAPGVAVEDARDRFAATFASLAGQRSRRADVTGTAFLLRDAEGGSIGLLRPVLIVLAIVAALVLLIACANLANLLLVRASRRRRELAVRVAMGASRGALVRLLFAESVVLAGAGGLAALALTTWTSGLLMGFAPPSGAPIHLRVPLDGFVFGFALLAATTTAVMLGVLPAWTATSGHLLDALKDGMPGSGRGRSRVRGALVVVQVALSVVLLAASGLCVRSLINARAIRPGFNTSGVLLASLDLYPRARDTEDARRLYRALLDGVGRAPGVQGVTLAHDVPLGLDGSSWATIAVDGYVPSPDERVSAGYNFVGPDYFRTLQTPVLRGRDFQRSDDERAERVVIVNEAMARRYWPGRDALGSRVRFWDEQWMRVVGIVPTTRQKELAGHASPYFYVPMLQVATETVTLHVRTSGDPAALTGTVRDAVRNIDESLPVYNVRTFADHARAATFRQRLAGSLLSVFGLLALMLATVGLYAVLALLVGQRTREFGIRLALGASAGDLRRMVLGQAGRLVAAGAGLGAAAALVVNRALDELLIGVAPDDALTLSVVVGVLSAAAVLACLAPARRAARLDPVQALRTE